MNYTRPAFDAYATLDFVIYAVLNALGLNPEPLTARPDLALSTHDDIAYRNARKFVSHFGGRPIKAMSAMKEQTGMDLKSVKEAWHHILDIYEVEADYHRAAIAACFARDNLGGVEYHAMKFRECRR